MFDSILVVCTGNICRSPIAERVLQNLLPSKRVDSAGVGALIDHAADPSAIKVAQLHGISLANHKGKQFTSKLAKQYDLLLVMEKTHLDRVTKIAPEVRGKTMLLGHWDNDKEIPDPYLKSDEAFESVYQLIARGCESWAEKFSR